MTHPRKTLSILLVLPFFLLGLASAASAHGVFEADGITVSQVWARASKVRNSAAYMTITNEGQKAVRLVGASTPVAKRAGLHTTRIEDGVMKMRPVKAIEIGPGRTVELKPGGYHVMLLGLEEPLRVDDHFEMTLTFDNGTSLDVLVHVRKASAMGMKMDMGEMPMGEGMNQGQKMEGMKDSGD